MSNREMTFSQAIEQIILDNGYLASLQHIYKEFPKYRALTGKTPLKTIQERVQRDPRFTRIGLGIYALTDYLDKLPTSPKPQNKEQEKEQTHYSIQGMLLEIGNMEGFDTYSPNKNAIFDNKPLLQIMTLSEFPNFTYPNIVQSVRFIDVLWFNNRGFPKFTFEVEITPQFRNSLLKFSELSDFYTKFYVIAEAENQAKYHREISRSVFRGIKERCLFKTCDQVRDMYLKSIEKQRVSADFFI
ncbi:hypothetical protein ES707_07021 [subsurface metagenome]